MNRWIVGVSLLSMACLMNQANAQSSRFTSNSATAQASAYRNGGSTGTSQSSGPGGSMSSTGSGSGSTSLGGGSSNAAGGTSALTQTRLNSGDGTLSATVGQNGLAGFGNVGTFVGSRQAASSTGRMSNSNPFSAFQNFNQNNNNFNNFNNQNNRNQRFIRPQFRIGFDSPRLEPAAVENSVQQRLTITSPLATRISGGDVTVDAEGVATVTGTVANEHDRRLMESVIRMSPGVRGVQNDLEVATAPE